MNCPNCGNQLPDGTTFCTSCGTPLGAQQPVQSPSDALFNAEPAYTPAPAKKGKGSVIGIIIGVIALLAIAFVVAFFVLGGRYNGTYKFVSATAFGMEMTLADLEAESGQTMEMSLEVTFGKCTLNAKAIGLENSGSAKIKIKGDEVTFIDGSQEMSGSYDSSEKSITINADGVELKFIKD